MADPIGYQRGYSFTNYQAGQPTTPLPGQHVDIELDEISDAIGDIATCLESVRRSDGALQNGIVTADSLSASVAASIPSIVGDAAVATAVAAAIAAAASAVAAAASAAVLVNIDYGFFSATVTSTTDYGSSW